MALLYATLFHPSRSGPMVRLAPVWVVPLLLLCGAHIASDLVSFPYVQEETLSALPPSATPADKTRVAQDLRDDLAPRTVFLPLRLAAGWCLWSFAVLHGLLALAPPLSVRYVHVLSLDLHCRWTLVAGALARLAAGWFTHDPIALRDAFSLAWWTPADGSSGLIFSAMNVFEIWYIGCVAAGLAGMTGLTFRRCLLVVASLRILTIVLEAGIIAQIGSALSITV